MVVEVGGGETRPKGPFHKCLKKEMEDLVEEEVTPFSTTCLFFSYYMRSKT